MKPPTPVVVSDALYRDLVAALNSAQKTIENQSTEILRLRLSLGLLRYKPPKKKAGRPHSSSAEADSTLLMQVEKLIVHYEAKIGKKLTVAALFRKLDEDNNLRMNEVKFKAQLKTIQNAISRARKAARVKSEQQ